MSVEHRGDNIAALGVLGGSGLSEGLAVDGFQRSSDVSFAKTAEMRRLESIVGDLRGFLGGLYNDGGMTQQMIADEIRAVSGGKINACRSTVGEWLVRLGFTRRSPSEYMRLSWQDPEVRERRIKGMEDSWAGDKKPERVEKIHTPSAREARAKAWRESWVLNPERMEKVIEAAKDARGRQRFLEMQKVLGDNPEARLQEMHHGQCLSVKQISRQVGRKQAVVRGWMRSLGVEVSSFSSIESGDREVFDKVLEAGFLEELPRRYQEVLRARFSRSPAPTLEKIGGEFGLTKARISQIIIESLAVLRARLARGQVALDTQ